MKGISPKLRTIDNTNIESEINIKSAKLPSLCA